MNILHYSLGFPPYRSGGLTKYSVDLMTEQYNNGNNIYCLFPGRIGIYRIKTKINFYKKIDGIEVYELINPQSVPLLNGILEPAKFMKNGNNIEFEKFLKEKNIEIIHIHTLMGLHIEFLQIAKKLNIKIVYTTHDYYGLCSKVNFIDYNGNCCEEIDINKCLKCNMSGYSINRIKLLQSCIYRELKNRGVISKAKKVISVIKGKEKKEIINKVDEEKYMINEKEFVDLLQYYRRMFECIDGFIYNSSVAKEIYNKNIKGNGKIITISHLNIYDNKKIKMFNHNKLKLTYLGPYKKYKGFEVLIDSMIDINKNYKNHVELNLYGDDYKYKIDDNIIFHGRYNYESLNDIFDNTDLLIVPSIWNETFGFIVIEALSYGVPVLISDKVGAKDLINNLVDGIIINMNKQNLEDEIIKIINNRDIIVNINKEICSSETKRLLFKNHYKDIMDYYKDIIYEDNINNI